MRCRTRRRRRACVRRGCRNSARRASRGCGCARWAGRVGRAQVDLKSATAVEQFRENFMPLIELAKRCRTWSEFQSILSQADSPEQIKLLTKMVAGSPAAAKRLGQVLALASRDGRAMAFV